METVPLQHSSLEISPQSAKRSLIADLPKNSTTLAVQAEEAGADAVLLNIDGEEGAHPSHFGSYDLHDSYINAVISTVSVPCGVMIGGGRELTEQYWERIMSSRFSFVEMYAHQMPLFVLTDARVKKVAAISTGYILEQVKQISQMEEVEAIDSATVPPQGRGSPFSVLDYATVGVVARLSSRPVLLRTQKKMTRADILRVFALGVRGLIVDPSVFSGTEEAYKEEVMKYRVAPGVA